MNKKENRAAVRAAAQKAVLRDEQNKRIQYAATHPIKETLKYLDTTLRGVDPDKVSERRNKFGVNKVTKEKKKSLPQRLAGAFINPFTAILFCLACSFCLSVKFKTSSNFGIGFLNCLPA